MGNANVGQQDRNGCVCIRRQDRTEQTEEKPSRAHGQIQWFLSLSLSVKGRWASEKATAQGTTPKPNYIFLFTF